MVPAGSKAKRFSSVNHTTKTSRRHTFHRGYVKNYCIILFQRNRPLLKHVLSILLLLLFIKVNS